MRKKIRIFMTCLFLIVLLLVLSIFYSHKHFGIYNPFVVLDGIIQVEMFEKDYYKVQEYPKVLVANKNLSLEKYMRNLGFVEIENKNLVDANSNIIYEFDYANISQNYVTVIDYKNFSVWMWRE